ncbi:MAG: hypothetical protein FD126_3736, partial [Elusimicrobia bacterium]
MGRGRDRVVQLEHRQVAGLRRGVLHEASRQELARLVVHDLFPQGLGDSLGDPAVELPLEEHGVDDRSHVVHADEALQPDLAALREHLHHRDVHAEGDREVGGIEDVARVEAGLHPRREVRGAVRRLGDLAERHGPVRQALDVELPVGGDDVLRGRFEQMSGDALGLLPHAPGRHVDRGPAHTRPAAPARAEPRRDDGGVAVEHRHI